MDRPLHVQGAAASLCAGAGCLLLFVDGLDELLLALPEDSAFGGGLAFAGGRGAPAGLLLPVLLLLSFQVTSISLVAPHTSFVGY